MREYKIFRQMIFNYVLMVHLFLITLKRISVIRVYKIPIVLGDIVLLFLKVDIGGKINFLLL